MRGGLFKGLSLTVAALLVVVLAACGSSNKSSSSSGGGASGAPVKGKQGGNLTVLYAGDVDNIDPGITYYQYGFNVAYVTQRPLYSFKPDDPSKGVPDLAASDPQISSDAKTVTVKIRTGVKFSPPVSRAVTSKDVKYGIERGFLKTVPSGYAVAYWGTLKGVKAYQSGKAKDISGIATPDDQTLVFHLTKPRGDIFAGALVLPGSAPVPQEYASKLDKKNPSAYGTHQVSTGPYMVQNDKSGKLTGYNPGKVIKLVRNPNWDKSTDYRPAYVDSITIKEGSDPAVGSRQILNSQSMVNGDFQVPPDIIKSTISGPKKDQLLTTPPTGRFRYIALNTKVKPFDNINVRKAVLAAFDRNALRLAFGGPFVGDIPTHFLPPGINGFDQAGGVNGPGFDFLAKPGGDPALAAQYMKKGGFPSGKYTGGKTFSAVADNATNQKKVAEVAQEQFAKLGFKVRTRFVTRDTMYTKFCQVPKNEPDICPSVGWLKDFPDAETLLSLPFDGKNILPVGNSNFAQLNDPKVNAAMAKGGTVSGAAQRAAAWGAIDKMVTGDAPGVPWLWDKQPNIRSANVNGVNNRFNATWDLGFTSLK